MEDGHSPESGHMPKHLDRINSLGFFFLAPDAYVERFACFHEQLFPTPTRGSLVAKKGAPPIVGRDVHPCSVTKLALEREVYFEQAILVKPLRYSLTQHGVLGPGSGPKEFLGGDLFLHPK